MARDESVTPPRGSGSIRLAEIARELAGKARRAALLFEDQLSDLAEIQGEGDSEEIAALLLRAMELHDIATELTQMADRFELWPKLGPEVVAAEREGFIDKLTAYKEKIEQLIFS